MVGHPMESWPDRLRRLRRATGLSQAKVAEKLGIAAPSVAQWEIGRSRPSIERLEKLASLYGVSLKELCGHDMVASRDIGGAETRDIGRITGTVSAADRVLINVSPDLSRADEIDLPFHGYSGILLEVSGESMLPRYKPGEIIGVTPNRYVRPSAKMIGKDAVVMLKDERILLKTIIEGPEVGTFALSSFNQSIPIIFNPQIVWISPIDFHLIGRA